MSRSFLTPIFGRCSVEGDLQVAAAPLVAISFCDSGAVRHGDNGAGIGQDRAEMCHRCCCVAYDHEVANAQQICRALELNGAVERSNIVATASADTGQKILLCTSCERLVFEKALLNSPSSLRWRLCN